MEKLWLVALGGAIGSCMRYLISVWSAEYVGAGFPYGTLLANVIGSFIIGAFMAAMAERFIMNLNLRFLVVIGFCGGLTTFSSFSYETMNLWEGSGFHYAMINVLANMVLSLLAVWLGMAVVRAL